MAEEPNLLERLTDLERIVVAQADRISAMEDELRTVHVLLMAIKRRTEPRSEAA